LIARALHGLGPRASAPFVPHNFAAIPESLIESEVFGHARGAFTGAHAERAGLFELADRGTLFLDEIGDASPAVQSRLLRVLQEGEVRRLGETRARRVDVRVIAATHRDLAAEVRAGRFRADLYYRLHVLSIRAPALRERREDIPLLAGHILAALARRDGIAVRGVRAGAIAALLARPWHGNVRELEGALERAVHALDGEAAVDRSSLGDGWVAGDAVREATPALRHRTRAYEAEVIAHTLAANGGNKTRTARVLGMTRQGLWKKIRRLEAPEGRRVVGASASPDSDRADPNPDSP
jgi:two-component system, NtrC family, response regulator HydG